MTVPKRDAIADELRREIADGTYSVGAKLPTEVELMQIYRVSRGTARDALAVLEDEGLVDRRVGTSGGTFVRPHLSLDIYAWRDDKPMSTTSEADLFFRTVREQGHAPKQDFSVHPASMTAEYAELLNVAVGSAATIRRCVRYVDDVPHSIQDSWYPNWLCDRVPRLREQENIVEGTTSLLRACGYSQDAALGYSIVHRLSVPDAATLRVSPSQQVLRHVLTGYTQDGPLRISGAIYAPGTRLMSAHGDIELIKRFRK